MIKIILYCSLAFLVSAATTTKKPWVSPSFCHSLECPIYTKLNQYTAYEVRQYEQSMWVSTTHTNIKLTDQVFNGMFTTLFNYIQGQNSAGQKIAMTAPVLDEIDTLPSGLANITRSFMVPFNLQPNPPTPTNPEVYIKTYPAMKVFVESFPGFDIEAQRAAKIQQLKDAINDNTMYDNNKIFSAGYDSPFSFANRHNEVWLIGV